MKINLNYNIVLTTKMHNGFIFSKAQYYDRDLNPRLTKLFFYNKTNHEGCCNPLWTWKINAWRMLIWYHSIAMGLLISYIPTRVQTSRVWRQNDVTIAEFAHIGDFQ